MTCASCVGRVEKVLRTTPGVADASVNLVTGRATVTLSHSVPRSDLVNAVKAAGYGVPETSVELDVEGMTCASCVSRVEKALARSPGVTHAVVNFATGRASVQAVGGLDSAVLVAAVADAGYGARLVDRGRDPDTERESRTRELSRLRQSLVLAASLSLPIFVLEMGSHLVGTFGLWVDTAIGRQTVLYLSFVLASIVQFGPGLRFYAKGVPALLRAAPDMNSLVVLGTTAAYGYSVVATFAPWLLPEGTVNVYYEAAAVIVTLILLGRYLEVMSKGRTNEAIRRLVGLQPKTARVRRDGIVVEVLLSEVRVGDHVVVRPGDKLPVDGVVFDGASYVDESMISGEPVPIAKTAGAEVIGGTINKNGSFVFTATKIGTDTLLAQIIRMVEQAQGAKLPIQAMVDRVTAWFVPAVIAVAVLTAGVWLAFGPEPALKLALVNAVATLIIACPCAMGLATPTSIMVGTGRAAELGILFRKGDALQTLRDASIVALDKTGTLTKGRPELTDMVVARGFDETEVLRLAAAAEAQSEHPIAGAIVAAADLRGVGIAGVSGFEALPGLGIVASVDGRRVQIGADRLMRREGVDYSEFAAAAAEFADDAKTPLYVAIDGAIAALIAVADPLKASTPAAIAALHELGLKVAMITGDSRRTAEAVARRLGIDEIVAEVLPDGKLEAVKHLRAGGRKVAFVGDGINDAPALAEADVGVAIGTGTDVAIETADVVLMSGDLRNVANAIGLSQATIRNIRENLFWAFAYNVILIPVAAGALYPSYGVLLSPIVAAGAMALSSVFVLSNALRLRRFRPRLQAEVAAGPEHKLVQSGAA
ncbi:MAG: heavy metal translocating P-type ATPase [Gammaproteobacteria bacterium]